MVAYFREKPLWRSWFWKVVLWLVCFASICMLVFAAYLAWVQALIPVLIILGVFVFALPSINILYKYSYKSPKTWN